jgi:hypothetical protein
LAHRLVLRTKATVTRAVTELPRANQREQASYPEEVCSEDSVAA